MSTWYKTRPYFSSVSGELGLSSAAFRSLELERRTGDFDFDLGGRPAFRSLERDRCLCFLSRDLDLRESRGLLDRDLRECLGLLDLDLFKRLGLLDLDLRECLGLFDLFDFGDLECFRDRLRDRLVVRVLDLDRVRSLLSFCFDGERAFEFLDSFSGNAAATAGTKNEQLSSVSHSRLTLIRD